METQTKEERLRKLENKTNNPRLKESIKQKMEILKKDKTVLK